MAPWLDDALHILYESHFGRDAVLLLCAASPRIRQWATAVPGFADALQSSPLALQRALFLELLGTDAQESLLGAVRALATEQVRQWALRTCDVLWWTEHYVGQQT